MLYYSDTSPIPWMLLIGIGYSITPVALYPVITTLTSEEEQGLAYGIDSSFINLIAIITNSLVGYLSSPQNFPAFTNLFGPYGYILVFFAFACLSLIWSIVWLLTDWWKGCVLNSTSFLSSELEDEEEEEDEEDEKEEISLIIQT